MKTSVRTRLIDERKHRQWSQREVADRIGTTQHNVSRWERGETTPGSYFRVKLCELFGKNPQELDLLALQEVERTQPAPPTLSPQTNEPHLPLWHVPHLRNPFFTGRDELLHSLHEALQQSTAAALTQSYALQAIALCNLAKLYQHQSKDVEAETLYRRVLQIEEQALRGDHPYMAFFLSEVANLYRKQRRYAEAEPLLQRAIHIREQTVGDNHPEIALPLTRLGALYREQGKYAKAKTLLQRAIHIREQALEAEYPDVAESYFELALLFLYQGNLPNAQHYYQQALAIWEKTFGLDHPQVALCIEEYARLEEEQAKA